MKAPFITAWVFGTFLFILMGCDLQSYTISDRLPVSKDVSTTEKTPMTKPPLPPQNEIKETIDVGMDNLEESNVDREEDIESENPIIQVVSNPESVMVLVNKQNNLPEGHIPEDLVFPNVPFTFEEKTDKRMLRKEAAIALEKLFLEAEKEGISLLGVSAYRSYDTQKKLFDYYVKRDGEEKARTYSAVPGQSEHQTGLAIDVTGGNRKCVVKDCFADTVEAKWLAKNAAESGFIIRYLEGKETITGYKYEPWHLRFVGEEMAKEISTLGVTLEEYVTAVPVTNSNMSNGQ